MILISIMDFHMSLKWEESLAWDVGQSEVYVSNVKGPEFDSLH